MKEKILMIIEISQKQQFIFKSKYLSDNIKASECIRYVTSKEFFENVYKMNIEYKKGSFKEENIVYSGGGNTVLEFDSDEEAKKFANTISTYVIKNLKEIEMFIALKKYEKEKTPQKNIEELMQKLAKKKEFRKNSFINSTYGIEAPKDKETKGKKVKELSEKYDDMKDKNWSKKVVEMISPYKQIEKFEDLGGIKNINNFIAVIHIDGNLMGQRVANFYKEVGSKICENEIEWKDFKRQINDFSQKIDKNYKDSYLNMLKKVKEALENQELEELELRNQAFPIRSIIMAGDDICFITEGRIGKECARIYLEELWKIEKEEKYEKYTACAGVAIVHQKYPFNKAYELSEELCSNAKKEIAKLKNSDSNVVNVSAIDWHISYGEMYGDLGEIRKEYLTIDKKAKMNMRPLIVCGEDSFLEKEKTRRYSNHRKLINYINKEVKNDKGDKDVPRHKYKGLREVIKKGIEPSKYYMVSNLMKELNYKCHEYFNNKIDIEKILNNEHENKDIFIETSDKEKRCICFDAIEAMDMFIPIGGENDDN